MDVIETFGNAVGKLTQEHPERARALLLAGYRAQELRLRLAPEKGIPPSGHYVAYIVMKNMIRALAHPEQAAMVSIFVPGELLTAAGMTPYSVEALSCFLTGTKCEQAFLARATEEGLPETMCSFHRVFLGAELAGLVPRPKCVLYTNLACDANMMTFPYLQRREDLPAFYIDVPYDKSTEAVHYVAGELREARRFLEDVTGRAVPEEALAQAVQRSARAGDDYRRQLPLRRERCVMTTLTNELYAILMGHLLAGTEETARYTRMLCEDVQAAPEGEALRILWVHMMPFYQQPVKDVFNFSRDVQITACDFVCDGFREMHFSDPYCAMAEKMVYSVFNGSIDGRIRLAQEQAQCTGADGVILFAHWGCKETIGATGLFKQRLEEAGFPTLILDGDGCNPANTSDGQVSTRLQAFLELLRGRKRP